MATAAHVLGGYMKGGWSVLHIYIFIIFAQLQQKNSTAAAGVAAGAQCPLMAEK